MLDNTARIEGWITRFPMFDWVGGRTSEMSAVGLLAAALQVDYITNKFLCIFFSCKGLNLHDFSLQGIDIKEMLAGADLMDNANRTKLVRLFVLLSIEAS